MLLICFWSCSNFIVFQSIIEKIALFSISSTYWNITIVNIVTNIYPGLIVWSFWKLYMFFLVSYFKLFLSVVSSILLILFNSFLVSLLLNLLERFLQFILDFVCVWLALKLLKRFNLLFSLIFSCFYLFLNGFFINHSIKLFH